MTLRARLKKLWQDWLSSVAFALLLTQFGATAVQVDGASMMPALRHREMVLVPKVEGWAHQFGLGGYQRGDILVFKPPGTASYEWKSDYRGIPLPWRYRPYLIKRVVGLPGDRVWMQAGRVYINGQRLPETAIQNYWNQYCHDTGSTLANTVASSSQQTDLAEIIVPAGTYFVMGDNRSPGGSLDSRMFGPVSVHDIAGRAVASFWPLAARTTAVPSCDGQEHPEQRVQYSGEVTFNPRLLEAQNR